MNKVTKTLKEWSIELGFEGVIDTNFYKKLKSVKRRRLYLKIEALLEIALILSFLYAFIMETKSMEMIMYASLSLLFLYMLYKNIFIWSDIDRIKQKRFKAYYEKNKD